MADFFDSLYREMEPAIRRASRYQWIPGMEPEDVFAEMTAVFWRAWQTWDPNRGSLSRRWWSMWLCRKADLIESYFAAKRGAEISVLTLEEELHQLLVCEEATCPECPSSELVPGLVWTMLAMGFLGTEVRRMLRLSVYTFYKILGEWRTPEVRALLVS